MARKHESSDTGNIDTPHRHHKVLPLNKKVKIPKGQKKKKAYTVVAKYCQSLAVPNQ